MATVTKELRGLKLIFDSANDTTPTVPSSLPGDGAELIQHNFRKLFWACSFDSVTGKDSGVFYVNAGAGNMNVNIRSQNDENLVYIKADSSKIGLGTSSPSERLHVVGNVLVESGWVGTKHTVLTITTSDSTIPITHGVCLVHTPTVTPAAPLSLDSGAKTGQILTVAYDSVSGNSFAVTADSTVRLGFDSVSFNAKGQTCTFQNIAGQWTVVARGGATLPTVA